MGSSERKQKSGGKITQDKVGRITLSIPNDILKKIDEFTERLWIFKEIEKWFSDPEGKRYFIITGKVGTGKSSIAGHLALLSCSTDDSGSGSIKGCIYASHFCSTRDISRSDPNEFSKNLSLQLAQNLPGFAEALVNDNIETRIDNEKPTIYVNSTMRDVRAENINVVNIENLVISSNITAIDFFRKAVRNPLEKVAKRHHENIIILVDALDESLLNEKDSILSLITNVSDLPRNVRFILTTRTIADIMTKFRKEEKITLDISSKDYQQESHKDILAYIKHMTGKDESLVKLNLDEEFAEQLAEKSEISNFLYVKFVLDGIAAGKIGHDSDSIATLPPGLDDLFVDFLQRIKEDVNGENGEKWEEKYEPILGLLSVAKEGLSIRQLSSFTKHRERDVGERAVDLRLKKLEPFTIKEKNNSDLDVYKLYHQSLVDFFRDNSHRFYLPPVDYHKMIVESYKDSKGWEEVNWKNVDDYGLRYLPDHLLSACRLGERYENSMYELARDARYGEQVRKSFSSEPEIALKAVNNALQYAAESKSDDPVPMAEFLLSYANRVQRITNETPLQVLSSDKDNLTKAWKMADLHESQTMELWYLLLAWKLEQDGRRKDAELTLERLVKKNLVVIQNPERYNVAFLLASAYPIRPDIFDALYHKLLEKGSTRDLSKALSSIAAAQAANKDYTAAVAAAKEIDYPPSRAKALSSIAAAQAAVDKGAAARTFETAVAAAKEIDVSYSRYKALSSIAAAQAAVDKEAAALSP